MAETKSYLNPVANSGFIDSSGKRHIFTPYGGIGRILTDDAALQAQLDAAIIVGGSAIRLEGNVAAVPVAAEATAVDIAREKLAAVAGEKETAQEHATRIRAELLAHAAKANSPIPDEAE